MGMAQQVGNVRYTLRHTQDPSDKLCEVQVGEELGGPGTQGLGPVPYC